MSSLLTLSLTIDVIGVAAEGALMTLTLSFLRRDCHLPDNLEGC